MCVYICVYMCVYIYIYIHTHVAYVFWYVCVYIYIYIYIHFVSNIYFFPLGQKKIGVPCFQLFFWSLILFFQPQISPAIITTAL